MSEEYILTRGQTSYIQAEYVVKLYYRNRAGQAVCKEVEPPYYSVDDRQVKCHLYSDSDPRHGGLAKIG